jgi:hypothetical protein
LGKPRLTLDPAKLLVWAGTTMAASLPKGNLPLLAVFPFFIFFFLFLGKRRELWIKMK